MTTLTMKEEKRIAVLQRVFRGELTMVEAALMLAVSERHSFRIKARMREERVKGVIHGHRGRRDVAVSTVQSAGERKKKF